MSTSEILGHIIVSGGVLLLGFFGWLIKQSIYGEFAKMGKNLENLEIKLTGEARQVKLQAERDVNEAKVLAATGLADIKETLRKETDAIKAGFVPIFLCDSERNGCQGKLLERIDKINETLSDKLDFLISNYKDVIERMNRHMNGER